ncbi:hypothetical protein M4D55_06460 [Metabacillus idriensis]|uniref:Uncharacterized protein n=1 Tax=Metabacillus idriensis TaxID=324768 RepID=A0A6I2M586_9BACI|nr:hypothetical protein [Metabacillus idriensis]MCM3595433.1 hypothetical protein [Metabacillus idriensis]MRX52542.1 hypothetical protein [Metabacillus idriensis]OHR72062.1 hypothetical protein HMPREF3291_22585 [Bacillus sp. HMSC76G11]
MSNLNTVLYDIHEYFILNPNLLRAYIEDTQSSENVSGNFSITNKALKLHFRDVHEEEYHSTLIPVLNGNGHNIQFHYGEDHTLYIYKKEEQAS